MDICNNIRDDDIFHFARKYLHILCNDKRTYEMPDLNYINMNDYIKFDDWCDDFKKLKDISRQNDITNDK